jgi:hypothetical protein
VYWQIASDAPVPTLHVSSRTRITTPKEEEMSNRHAYSVIGAALLSCAAVVTAQTPDEPQTHEQTATATLGQAGADEMPITLVGCIQRESEYRRQQDAGRGGVLATGLGNEYILINASRAGAADTSTADCSSATGEAYELSGKAEGELEPFVGRMVEISGMLKRAGIDDDAEVVGTTGTTAARPSGGFDPLGHDLQLYEVDVMSFREATFQQAEPSALAEPQETDAVGTTGFADDPADQPVEEPQAEPRAEVEEQQPVARGEELPGTASPLPLAGLIGLLSLAGALGLRRMRR